MKRWAWGSAAILLLGVLAIAIVFAVWASVGDAISDVVLHPSATGRLDLEGTATPEWLLACP